MADSGPCGVRSGTQACGPGEEQQPFLIRKKRSDAGCGAAVSCGRPGRQSPTADTEPTHLAAVLALTQNRKAAAQLIRQAVVDHHTGKPPSTHHHPWGILVIVHSVSRVTSCSSQPASPVPTEWTTS